MPGLLLDTLRGQVSDRRPVWLMRQAGRYLPEYRALRAEKGGFLELVHDSEAARRSPAADPPLRVRRGDPVLGHSRGAACARQDLAFLAGEGPRLSPPLVDRALSALEPVPGRLDPVYATVRLLRQRLGQETTLLGFAGSPWTVATYMIAGEGSRDHQPRADLAYRDPIALQAIIDAIVECSIDYLSGQIEAGAEAVQLFDSWAGSLAPREFERWVIAPNAAIATAIGERHPGVPVIGFPKGAGEKLPAYARETGVDAIGVDETIDPFWAARELPEGMPVQGNLDPLLLLAGSAELEAQARRILDAFADRPHVFNLGHGIDKDTPIAHVERLLAAVRGWRR
jgi:uroporphyrinogen decarboxylase